MTKETPLYRVLQRTFQAQKKRFRPVILGAGLSPGQPKILAYLRTHTPCMQKELSDFCDVEPPTVSRLLCPMEEADLLERRTHESSRRAAAVSITPHGLEALDECDDGFFAIQEEALKDFTPREMTEFTQYLRRYYKGLTGRELEY